MSLRSLSLLAIAVGFFFHFPADALAYYLEATTHLPPLPVGTFGTVLIILGWILHSYPTVHRYFFLFMSPVVGFVLVLIIFELNFAGSMVDELMRALRILAVFVAGWFLMDLVKLAGVRYIVFLSLIPLLVLGLAVLLLSDQFQAGFNYLRIGDSAAVSLLAVVALSRSMVVKVLVFSLGLVMLFYIGSRFSTLAFLISTVLYFFIISHKRRFSLKRLFLFAAVLPAIVIFGFFQAPEGSRLERLVTNPAQDASLQQRIVFTQRASEVIWLYPLKGNYKYYYQFDPGGYSHDLLSYAADFGLMGALYAGFILFILFKGATSAVWLLRRRMIPVAVGGLTILLSFYFLPGVVFARYWGFTAFYLALGLSARIIATRRQIGIGWRTTYKQAESPSNGL